LLGELVSWRCRWCGGELASGRHRESWCLGDVGGMGESWHLGGDMVWEELHRLMSGRYREVW